ncbi:MAG: hypothetical protein R3B09_24610 [Nannocystaceae bacterium]
MNLALVGATLAPAPALADDDDDDDDDDEDKVAQVEGPAPPPGSTAPAPANGPAPRGRWMRATGIASLVTGGVLFTVTYGVTALTGAIMHDVGRSRLDDPARAARGEQLVDVGRRLLIPIAGPWIAMPRMSDELGQIGAGFSGVIQAGALILVIAGGVQLGVYSGMKRDGVALGPRLRLSGAFTPEGGGLRLRF